MNHRFRIGLGVSYLLLIAAAVACAVVYALYAEITATHIPGADRSYRYAALGYVQKSGVNYTTIGSWVVDDLPPLLPKGISIGGAYGFSTHVRVDPHHPADHINAEGVLGSYLQALHLHAEAGRLLTLQDVRQARAVVVISAGLATHLFGSAGAAVGRHIDPPGGIPVTVVGVLPDAFSGTWRTQHAQLWMPYDLTLWYSGKRLHPKDGQRADLLNPVTGTAPLISFPRNDSLAEVHAILERLLHDAATRKYFPEGVHALIATQPYSPFPTAEQSAADHVRLLLGLAVGALALALVNVLSLLWLRHLQSRPVMQLERILGARRGYWLRRALAQGFLLYGGGFALAVPLLWLTLALLKFEVHGSDLGQYLRFRLLWPQFALAMMALLSVVWLAQLLPAVLLMAQDRVDASSRVVGRLRDRQVHAGLQVVEILLAALLSVPAAWAIQRAWHVAHAPLGFLDRPATLVEFAPIPQSKELPDAIVATPFIDLLMRQLRVEARRVAGSAAAGFGPKIGSGNFALMYPTAVSVGKRVDDACHIGVTRGWVTATGMRFEAGRNFGAQPKIDAALIDTRVADALFGSPAAAVGRPMSDNRFLPDFQARVRGVVEPIALAGADHPRCASVYPDKYTSPTNFLYTNSTLAIAAVLGHAQRQRLSQALSQVLRKQGMAGYLRVAWIRGDGAVRSRLSAGVVRQARAMLGLALFAWIIALMGIAALLRLSLAQRKRLLAVRSALGEQPTWLYGASVLETMTYAVLGMGLLLFALPWLAQRYALLSGAQVVPYGAATWIALTVLLLAVFMVAHFPARRAARAEPAESLHEL